MTEKEIASDIEILSDFNKEIFLEKYAVKDQEAKPIESEISQAFKRVSKTLAKVFVSNIESEKEEYKNEKLWEERFYSLFSQRRGMLAGRALLALGNTEANMTSLNCFVVPIDDSIDSILGSSYQAAAKIQQAGGGVGFNFSKIRPRGAFVKGVKALASGPVSFMKAYDSMVSTIASAGNRRGAAIAILDVDHPDIVEFITSKKDNTSLTNFNISIGITEEFIEALKSDKEIDLVHEKKIYGKIKARDIFDKFIKNSYNYNEPGIFFKDRVNEKSNSNYYQKIEAVNPCGEIPLPDYGCCCLGMIPLLTFVKNPFVNSEIDTELLRNSVKMMIFMLDTVLDATNYPIKQNEKIALQDRRVGLGITGLGDMLAMLKVKYDSDDAIAIVRSVMETIRNSAYEASVELAKLKGSFPKFDSVKFMKNSFIQSLPDYLKADIEKYGIRNVSLLTCQPAGTISLLLNNVSSGIEPIFSLKQTRRMRDERGSLSRKSELLNYSYKYYKAHEFDKIFGEKPDFFQTSKDVSLEGHMRMQNTIQYYVDNSISKTINFPSYIEEDEYRRFMFDVITSSKFENIKGMTTFREGTIASILTDSEIKIVPREKAKPRDAHIYLIRRKSGKPNVRVFVSYNEADEIKEVYLVTKDSNFYNSLIPYARLLSLTLSREKDMTYILELLKELEDTDKIMTHDSEKFILESGKEYNSILAAVKECIWESLIELDVIEPVEDDDDDDIEIPSDCSNCKSKNSLVSDGKCLICNVCGAIPPGAACSL